MAGARASRARDERVRLSKLPAAWRIDSKHGDVETMGGETFTFDSRAADRVCNFFAWYLTHTKGEFDGRPFTLERWQRLVLRRLFGWKRADGTRRYRTLFLFIPRKNGKSTLAAGISLYLTLADNEPGAEVYSAAADREQAAIVFDQAKAMVENDSHLQSQCQCYRRSIAQPESRSRYQVISADAKKKHGFNTHGAVIDELHAHHNRELYDVLTTSMGARRQPLTVIMTTAGYDRNSICYEQYDYARRVDQGIVEDGSYLAVLFECGEKDDWNSEETWRKTNPNLGVSISLDYLRGEHRKATEIPGFENTFKRLYLNIWTEQATRWLPMDTWRKCVGPDRDAAWLRSMAGRELFAGVDLSSTTDLTALVGVFPDRESGMYDAIARFWMPAKQVALKSKKDGVRYDLWAAAGFIELTEGSSVDQTAIEKAVLEWGEMYDLKETVVDRWEASRLIANLEGEGVKAFAHGQGYASMSGPSKDLERVLIDQRLRHGGHPVLEWMAGNVAIQTDPAGNIKPAKDKSTGRIDGIVALVMALGRAMLRAPDDRIVYVKANRGLLSL
jgi:phage terminase large subunit-like protein